MKQILYKCYSKEEAVEAQKLLFSINIGWAYSHMNVDPYDIASIVFPIYMCAKDGFINWFEDIQYKDIIHFYNEYEVVDIIKILRKKKLYNLKKNSHDK